MLPRMRSFAASGRISKRCWAIWSITPASGRSRGLPSRSSPSSSPAMTTGAWSVTVDDDGPGLSPSQREQVAHRGRRLDETKPGSGLGLSIVVELVNLYGGELKLGTAPIGGLRAELVLPSA